MRNPIQKYKEGTHMDKAEFWLKVAIVCIALAFVCNALAIFFAKFA